MSPRPRAIVVAGPSGSGKSTLFPVADFGVDAFNVDDRAAELNGGSYARIPLALRVVAQNDCEKFVAEHIASARSYAVETTLRSRAAIDQGVRARSAGFETILIFVATSDPLENERRIALRAHAGGHAAPSIEIADIFSRSLENLSAAIEVFEHVELWDNSLFGGEPALVATLAGARWHRHGEELPGWVPPGLLDGAQPG